jgi:hypothetical protein
VVLKFQEEDDYQKKKKKSLKPPEVGGHSDGKQVVKH